MCKTLKVEVPARAHIPLTPRGLAGVQGGRAPGSFWVFIILKPNEADFSKIAPFPLPFYSLSCAPKA